MKSISFVIPVYNSEQTIHMVVEEIEKAVHNLKEEYSYEIILVNDFSKDTSLQKCKHICESRPFIKLISFSKNFGQHHALIAGLRETKGDYIVFLDDDLQTPPKEVDKLIDTIEKGYDVVFAQYASKKHSAMRNLGSKLNSVMARALINKPDKVDMTSFVIIRRYVVNEMIKYENPYPYLAGLIFRVTTNIGGVEVEHRERLSGKSNYTFKKLITLWLNGFTSFSIKPLRISSLIGLLFSIAAFIFMIILMIRRIIYPSIPMGWTSVMVMIMFFGGIQLLSLGLVGEYVGRIFLSINKAPQYVIKEKYSSSTKVSGNECSEN